MKKAFIICSVRNATEELKEKLESFANELENKGWSIHLPHRDTNQNATSIEICRQNYAAIKEAGTIFIFYNSGSLGTHFDMGMAFALNKEIVVIENEKFNENKSFARLLAEWSYNKYPICEHKAGEHLNKQR